MAWSHAAAADRMAAENKDEGPYGWYPLALLAAIYACHALDRAVVSVVIEPLKRDLALSDTAVGAVTGLGYGVAFAVAAVPLGFLADRVNRVRLMTVLVLVWSGMTALAGLARNAASLMLARIGVGAAEAGGQPTAISILTDIYPERMRSFVLSMFYLGTSAGYSVSYLMGAFITTAYGWRAAFFIAGGPGLLLGTLLFLTIREPKRTGHSAQQPAAAAPFGEIIRHLCGSSALRHLFAAVMLASFYTSTMLTWMVPLLMREHHMSLNAAGAVGALTMGGSQALGAVLSGSLADRMARHGADRRMWVAAAFLTASFPLALGAAAASDATVAGACLVAFGLFAIWTPPAFATVVGQAGIRMRGSMLGVAQLCANLSGAALSPFVTGLVSDTYGGTHSLAVALGTLSVSGLWASFHYVLAGRRIRDNSLAELADARMARSEGSVKSDLLANRRPARGWSVPGAAQQTNFDERGETE